MWPNCEDDDIDNYNEHSDKSIFERPEPEHFDCTYCNAEGKHIVVDPILIQKANDIASDRDNAAHNHPLWNYLPKYLHRVERDWFKQKVPFKKKLAWTDKDTDKAWY